jgi:hypothetical protein
MLAEKPVIKKRLGRLQMGGDSCTRFATWVSLLEVFTLVTPFKCVTCGMELPPS